VILVATGWRDAKASAANIYVAQSAAGTPNGSSCANAYAVTFANTPGNWGTGAAQIGPGTTVHLCGVITTGLQINGSGTSGNVITVKWEAGARISQPVVQGIDLNGASAYLLFDGGVPCGPGTACDSVEAANQTGYVTGQAGIIESTANGSQLANQTANSHAFYDCSGCHDIEVRNLIIRNMYVHSLMSDATSNIDGFDSAFACPNSAGGCAGGVISIHDSTLHDMGNAIQIEHFPGSAATINLYNLDSYHNNWAVENSGYGPRTLIIHNNHWHDAANWDTTADAYHHNGLHSFMGTSSDSLGIYIYNNLSDGNWGTCCTTSSFLFIETVIPDSTYVFNNVVLGAAGENTSPASAESGTTGSVSWYNNTLLGSGTSGLPSALLIAGTGTGFTFENNADQGYGEYLVFLPGYALGTVDYNVYGSQGPNGNAPWACEPTMANTFSLWQSGCSVDAHGHKVGSIAVSSTGQPQAGSPLIRAGANLASLCSGYLVALCSDAAGKPRHSTGPWDVGAYQGPPPSPPTNLTGTPR
jgi:hypothetical protein